MARRGASDAAKQAGALQAGRLMIARGERPLYRVRTDQDGRWTVEGCPWLSMTATDRRVALDEARAAVASWLDVRPDSFEIEVQSIDW